MSDPSWDDKAEFMRRVGATDCAWSTNGELLHVVLGPAPTQGPAARMKDFHERTAGKSLAERQHDILFASTSVRPRMVDMTPPNAVPRAERAKRDAQRGTEGSK